jgi:hypothetical protein
VWNVITRVVQIVLLLYMLVKFAALPPVQHTPQSIIICAVMCGLLAFIRAYHQGDAGCLQEAADVKLGRRIAAASHGSVSAWILS